MKPAKPVNSKNKTNSPDFLSVGAICLFAAGVLAAKIVFLVDNDLEIKTKFSGQSWQLNSQSIRHYFSELGKFAAQYLHPLSDKLRQQSTAVISNTSNALKHPQKLCVSRSQLTTIVDRAKRMQSIELANSPPAKTDRPIKPTSQVTKTAPPANSATKVDPALPADRSSQSWCITSGK